MACIFRRSLQVASFYHRLFLYQHLPVLSLKIALTNIGSIIENVEDNWVVYELLMRHKNVIHKEIDLMLKEKNKCRSWITSTGSIVDNRTVMFGRK
jgi:IS1 family transposase